MAVNRHLLTWSRNIHVYLSIALLLVLVFFAITGITLNHAASMSAQPEVSTSELELPPLPRDEQGQLARSVELADFLRNNFNIRMALAELRHEDGFLIIDYQTPGRTILVEIDEDLNEVFAESTDFGLIAALNDLHKGRHTDVLWSVLIDLSGVLLVLFALAGFVLLLPNRRRFSKVMQYSGISIAALIAIWYFFPLLV